MAPLILYHTPMTRSTAVRVLLEELGAPYTLERIDMKAGEHRQPAFRAINPMAKIPVLRHGDAIVTEQVAITIYLADLFPAAGLAPSFDDPLRGPYLRWIAFFGCVFEPVMAAHAEQRPDSAGPMATSGTYDDAMAALEAQLTPGPWLLGERFTAADVLFGMSLNWTVRAGFAPDRPAFAALSKRLRARPAFQRVVADEKAIA